MPDVAQIDAGAGGDGCAVGCAVVCERLRQYVVAAPFGRQCERGVASVGERFGDAPAHVALLDVWYRSFLERVCLVEEESSLEVGELVVFLSAVGQGCSSLFYVLLSAAFPCAFGGGEYVGILVVLPDDVGFSLCLGVVPCGGDGAGYLLAALLCIVYVALVDAHEVGIHVEVVDVVVAAVDVGHSAD